ncbi:MFS transporter [Acidisphaera sp. L21]|uniref:MFS transporter n=1 Tax=Acidisphaera sp. L21 TaxID=1641851 RepID=UPI00131E5A12|nr:MFS transporter [Acidisphaera sp. L21]
MQGMNVAPNVLTNAARRNVVAAMLIATFMVAAEVTVISTAMPTIVARLGGFDLFTWAFGIYLLGQAVTTPIYGRLADLYGRRTVYLCSTAVFLVGSLLCGVAWSMPALIVFRAIQGLGGGGLVPLATIIIGDVSAPPDRARMLSYVSGIWGIAAIIGPLLGSLCVGTVGWPFVFWINLPIGVVTMAVVWRNLHDPVSQRVAGRIDVAGAILLAVGIGAGMATLVQWETLSTTTITALLVLAALCLGVFGVRERQTTDPMLALQLLRLPVILAANASTLLCGALIIGLTAFVPAWVQGVLGDNALAAGFILGVMTVCWSSTAMILGRTLGRLPNRSVALVASIALVVGSAGLLVLSRDSVVLLVVASAILGAGLGSTSLVFTVAVQMAVSQADRGRATSLYYFSRLVGQAVGAAAFGGILNAGLSAAGPEAHGALRALMDPASRLTLPLDDLVRWVPTLGNALHQVFTFAFGLAILCVPVALIVPRRR